MGNPSKAEVMKLAEELYLAKQKGKTVSGEVGGWVVSIIGIPRKPGIYDVTLRDNEDTYVTDTGIPSERVLQAFSEMYDELTTVMYDVTETVLPTLDITLQAATQEFTNAIARTQKEIASRLDGVRDLLAEQYRSFAHDNELGRSAARMTMFTLFFADTGMHYEGNAILFAEYAEWLYVNLVDLDSPKLPPWKGGTK